MYNSITHKYSGCHQVSIGFMTLILFYPYNWGIETQYSWDMEHTLFIGKKQLHKTLHKIKTLSY